MKFIVDSADLGIIRDCYEHFACDGVTTNPSILAKSGVAPAESGHFSERMPICTCR